MNYDAFSHGQIKSKLWLCENLEPLLKLSPKIVILGSWYNVLGFMLKCRNPSHIITGIDIDSQAIDVANRITDYWKIENQSVNNLCGRADDIKGEYDVVINCSSEHMDTTSWFDNIKPGTLVCIQSSDITDPQEPWIIKNPSESLGSFRDKYPLKKLMFLDALKIDYGSWGYQRFMLIGIK